MLDHVLGFLEGSSLGLFLSTNSIDIRSQPTSSNIQAQGAALRQEIAQIRGEVGVASTSSEAAVGQANGVAIKLRRWVLQGDDHF